MCFIFCRACIVQLKPLMLKPPRRYKCDGFLPAISCINSKSNLVFSLVEFWLRFIQPIIKLSPPDKFILHQVDSESFRFALYQLVVCYF